MDELSRPLPDQASVRLRILETTDLHVHIMPHDYLLDRPDHSLGLALTANLIHAARAEADNCLLFDNGDFLQGTPLSDWAASDAGPADHPMIAAMNHLAYDAACIGNHEFNYGLGVLQTTLAQVNFPVISANICKSLGPTPYEDDHLAEPWRILPRDVVALDGSRHTLRIGVIGLAPPQIPTWDRFALGDQIKTRDIIEAATAHVAAMKSAGADIVIALSHAGIGSRKHRSGMENANVPLAAIDGIDAVLAGHTHKTFPDPNGTPNDAVDPRAGTLHGKPAVQAGCFGSHLGQIDLDLRKTTEGWRVAGHEVCLVPVTATKAGKPDPTITHLAQPSHQAVLTLLRERIATTTAPLHSHFAQVAPSAALTLLADAMRDDAENSLRGTSNADLPLIVAVQPHNTIRAGQPYSGLDTPAGDVQVRHASQLYPYPNEPCLLEADGATLRLWLENAARGFRQIRQGATDQPLLNPAVPGYQLDVLFGLRYVIDISQPPGHRIDALTFADGTPVRPDSKTIISTTTYRAGGGGGYDMARACKTVWIGEATIKDVLVGFLRSQGTIQPRAEQVWRFATCPDTRAWFETSASALAHVGTMDQPRISPDAVQDSGLHRFTFDFGT